MIRRRGIGRGRLEVTSKERAERRRRLRRRRSIIILVVLLAILAGIIGIFHIGAFRIKSVQVSGMETISESELTHAITADIAGSYFFLIPKNSIFWYPKSKIEKDVIDSYPEIQTFSLGLSHFTTLEGKVTERHQVGIWCGGVSGDDCYFLDENGFLYSKAPHTIGNVYFTYRGEVSNGTTTSSLRASFLTPESFKKVSALLSAVKDQKLFTPISFERTSEEEGIIASVEGTNLLVNISNDNAVTLANLTSALGGSSLQDPKVRASLEYIDLRFGNKIYYKLRGGAAAPAKAE